MAVRTSVLTGGMVVGEDGGVAGAGGEEAVQGDSLDEEVGGDVEEGRMRKW